MEINDVKEKNRQMEIKEAVKRADSMGKERREIK